MHTVPLGSLESDAELKFLARSAGTLKLDTELLDIGPADGTSAYVVLARAVDPGTGRWFWAIGSRPRWRAAAITALRDLLGVAQLGADPAGGGAAVDTGDRLLTDLEPGALTVHDERPAPLDAGAGWRDIIADLRRTHTDALVVPTTSPDLTEAGLQTARVLLAAIDGHAR